MPWSAGQSGNPGGQSKNALKTFLVGIPTLPQEIYNAVHPLLKSKSESMRLQAAEFFRDSTWGKPATILDSEFGGDIVVRLMSFAANLPSPAASDVVPGLPLKPQDPGNGNGHSNGNGNGNGNHDPA